jgi:hypothetical protein
LFCYFFACHKKEQKKGTNRTNLKDILAQACAARAIRQLADKFTPQLDLQPHVIQHKHLPITCIGHNLFIGVKVGKKIMINGLLIGMIFACILVNWKVLAIAI